MASAIWDEKAQRWVLRLSIDGKRKKFTCTTPGLAGKREVLRRSREFLESGVRSKVPTVGDVWPEFLDDVLARASLEQHRNVELNGRLYILPKVGSCKISKLTQNDWQKVINEATGRDGHILAKKSLENIRSVISSFLVFCFRCGLIPTKETSLYIPAGHPAGEKEILQPDQVRRIFSDEFSSDWFINLWRFMLLTGVRPGEALGLQWSDFSSGSFTINRSINARGRVTPGKNENAHRVVPLSSMALEVIADQKQRTSRLDSEWVFCNQLGSMPKQALTFKYFKKISLAVGSPNVSPYGLRHTFVSLLKMSPVVPEQMVKAIVGHSDSMPTFKIYGHAVDGDQERMASALDAAFSSTVPPVSRPDAKPEEVIEKPGGAVITQLRAN